MLLEERPLARHTAQSEKKLWARRMGIRFFLLYGIANINTSI